jgi:two-component system, OmpR family, phosphate regulon sensor histidine kinase PhoR
LVVRAILSGVPKARKALTVAQKFYTGGLTVRSSIFGKLLLSSALLIGVTLASADFVLTRYAAERERSLVKRQMAQSLRVIAPTLVANPPKSLQKWAEDTDAAVNARVTIIDSGGVVVADSRHDPETMQNHRARPEVSAALAGRPGSAFRRSATLDVEYYYYAEPVESPGHPRTVLRLAIPLTQVGASIAAVRTLILRSSAVAALLALLLAYLVARTFTRRIRRIENYAKELVNADYSGILAAEGDDELGSVARSLRAMAEHFRGMLARLAQESSRREAILGSMVEGVLAVERSLRITFYNDAFARAVHASVPAPNGVSLSHVVRDPALGALLSRVIATGTPARERMCLISAEGRIFQVQAAPLDEPGGGGAIATFHDITELERLERTRKDFVANVSHELRTPLAAIQGYAETLLEGALEDTENSRRFLQIIVAHTTRINNLASDLLTLSEIEAERISVPSEKISAVELVENALQRVAARATERDIRACFNAADEVYVVGQRGRLERAISNLLLNAIDFNTPGGEVRIDVRRVDATVRISIADDGIGIAPQDLRRIFERFYRVDKARSHQTGGAGLGLSIVKNTVERAGGSIIVDSQLGKGSVFTLVFPAV